MVDQSIQKSIVNFSNGNGFIVTQDGVIFTCFHVIEDYFDDDKIPCIINQKEYFAKIIDTWETLDFAIVQIYKSDDEPKEFESIPLGIEPAEIDPSKNYGIFHYNAEGKFDLETGRDLNPYYPSPEIGLNYLKFKCDVMSGMSGSPIWDFQSQRVIGVVIEQDPKDILDATRRAVEPLKTKIFGIAVSMNSIVDSIMKSEIEFSPLLMNIIKQIKEEVQVIGIPDIPTELKLCIEDERNPDFVRVNEVYRNPKGFEDVLEKLKSTRFIIITGPPNIGKTSTAYKLANTIKQDNKEINLIFSIRNEPIKYLRQLRNSIIIFDDVFGKVKFTNEIQANEFSEYQKLTKFKNYLIYTTREEVLSIAKNSRSEFGEFPDLDDHIFRIEPEGSYDDNTLEQILDNHLNYYFKQDYISKNEIEIAENNKFEIIEKLRFPHNYKELVEIELSKVSKNGLSIEKAIENAKHIKKSVERWFTNMEDKSMKFFIFTLALFQDLNLNDKEFNKIYLKVIELLKKRHSDLNVFRIKTLLENPLISTYIRKKGDFIDFIHPNYLEGVLQGIFKYCVEDINAIQPLLKEIIVDKNVDIRRAITYTLGEIGKVTPELAIPLLKKLMKDEESWVRRSVAEALGKIGKKEPELVVPLLKEMMKDEEFDVRRSVAETLGEIGKKEPELVVSLLKEMMRDEDTGVRRSVAEALGEIGKIELELVVSLLKEMMRDEDTGVRRSVAIVLGEIGKIEPELVVSLLKEMMRDEYFWVRRFVAEALGKIGKIEPELVILLLKEMMRDEYLGVRRSVAEALGRIGKIGPELVIRLLKEMMKDEDTGVRRSVAEVLGEIGKIGPELVIPLLKEMMRDEDSWIREIVKDYIKKL